MTKLVLLMAGADKNICVLNALACAYASGVFVNQLYEDDGMNYMFPDLATRKVNNSASTQITAWLRALSCESTVREFADYKIDSLPGNVTAGGQRIGGINELATHGVSAEFAIFSSGHEAEGLSTMWHYIGPTVPLCVPGARVLAGWPAPAISTSLMRAAKPASLAPIREFGISAVALDAFIDSLLRLHSRAVPPSMLGSGLLRPITEALAATLVMYHNETVAAAEASSITLRMKSSLHKAGLAADAGDAAHATLSQWSTAVAARFKIDNLALTSGSADGTAAVQICAAVTAQGMAAASWQETTTRRLQYVEQLLGTIQAGLSAIQSVVSRAMGVFSTRALRSSPSSSPNKRRAGDGDEAADGERADGERADGERADGERAGGERAGGERADDARAGGEHADGAPGDDGGGAASAAATAAAAAATATASAGTGVAGLMPGMGGGAPRLSGNVHAELMRNAQTLDANTTQSLRSVTAVAFLMSSARGEQYRLGTQDKVRGETCRKVFRCCATREQADVMQSGSGAAEGDILKAVRDVHDVVQARMYKEADSHGKLSSFKGTIAKWKELGANAITDRLDELEKAIPGCKNRMLLPLMHDERTKLPPKPADCGAARKAPPKPRSKRPKMSASGSGESAGEGHSGVVGGAVIETAEGASAEGASVETGNTGPSADLMQEITDDAIMIMAMENHYPGDAAAAGAGV